MSKHVELSERRSDYESELSEAKGSMLYGEPLLSFSRDELAVMVWVFGKQFNEH